MGEIDVMKNRAKYTSCLFEIKVGIPRKKREKAHSKFSKIRHSEWIVIEFTNNAGKVNLYLKFSIRWNNMDEVKFKDNKAKIRLYFELKIIKWIQVKLPK